MATTSDDDGNGYAGTEVTDESTSVENSTSCDSAKWEGGEVDGFIRYEYSHEWGELNDCDSLSETGFKPASVGRHTRYKNMARAIEAAEQAASHRGKRKDLCSVRLQALCGIFLFFGVNAKVVTSLDAVLHGFNYELISPCNWKGNTAGLSIWFPIFFGMDMLFIAFQIACVRRDRYLSEQRHSVWNRKNYFQACCLNIYTFVVLGVLSGWQLLRSWRQWRRPGYRDSFLAELNDPGFINDHALTMPLYSSHLTFLYELLFVCRTVHVFTRDNLELCDVSFVFAWVVCYFLVVIALVTFDYSVSSYIRNQYAIKSSWLHFGWRHCLYRSCECMARFLVIGATMLKNVKHHQFKTYSVIFADVYIGLAVLCWASNGISKRCFFMSIPLLAADLALFADDDKLAASANKVTWVLDIKRSIEAVVAAIVYQTEWTRARANALEGNRAFDVRLMSSLVVMLGCGLICAGLRITGLVMKASNVEHDEDMVQGQTSDKTGKDLFGRPVEESIYFQSGNNSTLVALLFARGIGDQFASLLEIFWERDEMRLSRLAATGRLGEGGFGKVIKVRDTRTGCEYALKLQRKDYSSTSAVREAENLHQFRHSYIVELVRVFRTRAFYGILLELCELDLNKYIISAADPDGKVEGLPKQQVQHFTACMTLALEHLHDRCVVFRDLKPENVLTVTSPDGKKHVKLADFGLAKEISEEDWAEVDRGHSESVVSALTIGAGTPAFMSAECNSQKSLVGSSRDNIMRHLSSRDWYALGCCLLLMMLGERGGRLAVACNRKVLLPPACDEICSTVTLYRGCIGNHAVEVLLGLLGEAAESRAKGDDLRKSRLLREALLEAETIAATLRRKHSLVSANPN